VIAKVPVPETKAAAEGSTAAGSLEVIEVEMVWEVAVFPKASCAVTVKLKLLPEVLEAGTELKTKLDAEAGLTVRLAEVTERVPSVTVSVLVPAVLRVAVKEPVPEVRVALPGSVAAESEDEKLSVPAYEGTVFPAESFAVMVKEVWVPAVRVGERPVITS